MWVERNVDVSHGEERRPVLTYHPESDADVRQLEAMLARGEIGMSRGEEDRRHVKVAPGQWLWLGAAAQVDLGYIDLTNTLRALRPEAMELCPAVFALPRLYSEVLGKDGVNELADQARLLLGDEGLLNLLSENARLLVMVLGTLDVPEAMSEEDREAPGQGEAAPKGEA